MNDTKYIGMDVHGWAGRQEKIRPREKCFFLDSLYRTNRAQED